MLGKLSMATAVGLGLLLPLLLAGRAIADENSSDQATKPDNKKVDKYLGIDWGDDAKKDKKKADDPNAAEPSKEVDLTTALSGPQARRLAVIKKKVAKADKLAELAAKTLAGQNKGIKKSMAVRQYDGAAAVFKKALADIAKLAKSINDDDTRLTLLRQYGDKYKQQACELLCKAGQAAIATAGNKLDNLKLAVKYFKRARKIDPTYPGIAEGIAAVKSAYKDITVRVAETKNRNAGGSGNTTTPHRGREAEQQGHTDQSQEGRDYQRDTQY